MNVAPRVAGRSAHGRLWHYRSATMVDAIGTACRTRAISAAAVPIVPVIHRTTASNSLRPGCAELRDFGLLEPRGRHAGPRVVRRLRVRVAYQMGMTGISI